MSRESGATPAPQPSPAPYMDPDLYDLIYAWYDPDIAFYVDAARHAGGPVLEAACGTGRVLLPARAAGVDIDGFDLEPAMIRRLQDKAAAQGLTVNATVADMRDLTLPRQYRLITIPFRPFMHLMTTQDQIRALHRLRDHLEPGGALLFDVFYPNFKFIQERDGVRQLEREFDDPESGMHVTCYYLPRYDRVQQTAQVEREVVFTDATGVVRDTRRHGFALRWTYRFEMELLLEAAGFARWEVRGGFDGRPLLHDTDEMVWTTVRD